MSAEVTFEIGVDTGGTFTDVVCRASNGAEYNLKIPSTRSNPGLAILRALDELKSRHGIEASFVRRFMHGTTVATNAILEQKGSRIGLLTTEGFRDVLEIGRQMRSARQMYAFKLRPETPTFLVPRRLRKGVRERIGPKGEIITPLDQASLVAAIDELAEAGVEAIGISFLFSFANPEHELRAAEEVRKRHPHIFVSASHEVDPAMREYERTAVTAFDAYVRPIINNYLSYLEDGLRSAGVSAPLQIMQSRGGLAAAAVARKRPVRLFLSGPAAGVVEGSRVGDAIEKRDLITVDVGGTSCDIALIAGGKPLVKAEGVIGGYPVRVGMVDVNTIGSGGGSIVWIDGGGGLRVGPESAGAEPGPACYGRGGKRPTVTDASIVLGYLDPEYFAAGTLQLEPELARQAVRDHVAQPLGITLEEAALGIHRVVNAQMAEAIRLVSIRQGIDPRSFSLMPLGGGGGIHATALADELSIKHIVVPAHPGVLCASGLLSAAIEHEVSAAYSCPLADVDLHAMLAAFKDIDRQCNELMKLESVAANRVLVSYAVDICYIGQAYTLEVPFSFDNHEPIKSAYENFVAAHERVYGFALRNPARVVNVRTVHRALHEGDTAAKRGVAVGMSQTSQKSRPALFANMRGFVPTTVVRRETLTAKSRLQGPAIVEQEDTTTLVGPGWEAVLGADSTLLLSKKD